MQDHDHDPLKENNSHLSIIQQWYLCKNCYPAVYGLTLHHEKHLSEFKLVLLKDTDRIIFSPSKGIQWNEKQPALLGIHLGDIIFNLLIA